MAELARGRAPARAALAGNPSDGYGGAVLALAVEAFAAEVVLSEDARRGFAPEAAPEGARRGFAPEAAPEGARRGFAPEAAPEGARRGSAPSAETLLLDATIARFHRDLAPHRRTVHAEFRSTIPRCVGLGGSSAIVIATLRALCEWHDVPLHPDAMAALALSIEVDDLGIAAGLQDRIAQAYGGVTFMEFGSTPPRYESIDAAALPPLVIAWRELGATPSGIVHSDLRARFEAGDLAVRSAMTELAQAARAARDALSLGDVASLRPCVDASFDARARMLALDPHHVEMVQIARGHGAAANYTGSGGAIVAVCNDLRHRDAVAQALSEGRCGTVVM